MAEGFARYEAFFGRPADFVLEPQHDVIPPISVLRFPPVAAGFLRRLVTPVHDRFVYITHGMSLGTMKVPANEIHFYPPRIELITYSKEVHAVEHRDTISVYLRALAAVPFVSEIFFGPSHTAALEEPISSNSEMHAFFFAIPDGVEMRRLCSCTPSAQLVVSVLPITTSEKAFIVNNGPERFVELLDKHKVPNLFDPFRKPVV